MTQQIKFDALRYCRSNAGRMGTWQGKDVAGLIAGEVEALRAELAALKEAAKAVAKPWVSAIAEDDERHDDELIDALDALAALVGEG